MHSDFSAQLLAGDFTMRPLWSNLAAPVDVPMRVSLRWSRLGRRATEQQRSRL
jgi:hypothetical protein